MRKDEEMMFQSTVRVFMNKVLRYLTNKCDMLAMQMTGIKLYALFQTKCYSMSLCDSFIIIFFFVSVGSKAFDP